MSTLAGTRAGRTLLLGQTFARPWRMTAQEARETLRAAASPPAFRGVQRRVRRRTASMTPASCATSR